MEPRPWMLVAALLIIGCAMDDVDETAADAADDASTMGDAADDDARPAPDTGDARPGPDPDVGPSPADAGRRPDGGACPEDDPHLAVDRRACRGLDPLGGEPCDDVPPGLVCEYFAQCDREVDPGSFVVCCEEGTWSIIYEDPDPCGLPPAPDPEPDAAPPDGGT